jgi:hypothetical protein
MTLVRENGFLAAGIRAFFGAALLACAAIPGEAQNREERCRDYAREASEAAEQADRARCGFSGPRWSSDRSPHFAWCMLFPRQAEDEGRARKDELRSCVADRGDRDRDRGDRDRGRDGDRDRGDRDRDDRHNREGKRANCDTYSSIASVQADANDKYKCGYRGGEWANNKRAHFEWCMTNKREFALDEQRFRAQELQKCFNNLGDYDDDRWERNYRRRF